MSNYRVSEHTKTHSPFVFQPVSGAKVKALWKLARKHGIAEKRWFRFGYILVLSLLCAPFKLIERHTYDRSLRNYTPEKNPIIILGHWRSGTTHLHNILCKDPENTYYSTYKAWAPHHFMLTERWLKPFIDPLIPKERPMDKVALSAEEPQEEEFALANLGPHSFYHGMYFNDSIDDYFDRYVSYRLADTKAYEGWKNDYSYLINKLSFATKGKRVIAKNPANTARIDALLELYPNAKFVHISRNPYKVYASTVNLYNSLGYAFGLGKPWKKNIEDIVLRHYRTVMMSYLSKRHLIPKENLIDIRYENFIKDEVGTLEMIYKRFDIDRFEEAKPHFQSYLDSIGSFEKNSFELDAESIQQVSKNWQFAFERLRYPHKNAYTRHNPDVEETKRYHEELKSEAPESQMEPELST